jgi:hypothetical protein
MRIAGFALQTSLCGFFCNPVINQEERSPSWNDWKLNNRFFKVQIFWEKNRSAVL